MEKTFESGDISLGLTARETQLGNLLGLPAHDVGDVSLAGRLKTISRLRAARLAEIKRGQTGSWLYDVNRHLAICKALRNEYEALADSLDAVDAVIWRRTSAGRAPTAQADEHI